MIPLLAAAAFLALIAYLFWDDIQKRGSNQPSWAPLVWMFLAGSRWASSWLSLGSPLSSVDSYSEGSPVDRAVFFALIIWGAVVLSRRNIKWGTLFARNKWIALYLLYCLASMLWSDEPVVLIKRWVKDLGNPIMALVMLTERRPYEALGITLRRLAFLLLPLSVLFVRYFPELGRTYHHDGSPMYTGAGHQKNDLGLMCLVTGVYFAWKFFQRRDADAPAEKADKVDLMLVGMMAWLLHMSNSQTSLMCLIVATTIMIVARLPFMVSRQAAVTPTVVMGGVTFAVLEYTLQIKERILEMLGRDASLTNRTDLWEAVLRQAGNPIVGAGFMSFWTGERMQAIWDAMGTQGINQAHSGYIEQWINLGYVGLVFIVGLMLLALFKAWRQAATQPAAAILRLCLIVVAALYNYTEASFYGINNMWVLTLAASLDVSGQPTMAAARRRRAAGAEVGAPRIARLRRKRSSPPSVAARGTLPAEAGRDRAVRAYASPAPDSLRTQA